SFPTYDLGHVVTMPTKKFVSTWLGGYLAHVEDEVVLVQPVFIGLDQGWSSTLQLPLDNLGRQTRKVSVPNPPAGKANQGLPVTGERQLENHAENAVVVVLDLTVEALTAVENQRLNRFHYRGSLVLHVPWGRVFEAGFCRAGSEDLPKFVEPNLFGDVKLDQDQNRPMQGGIHCAHGGCLELKGLLSKFRDGRFAFHDFHCAPEV